MEKINLEYILKVSPKLLFNRISNASGLSEWFADDVFVNDDIFTFVWNDSDEKAKLISKKSPVYVRFKWLEHDDEDTYFEFKIETHELSNDITLIITDFAEEDEKEESINLWEAQISNLKNILGL